MQDDLPDWELDLTAPMYDETGNIPSNECESPASDYWDDGLVWDEQSHRYVYRTESDKLLEEQYPDNPCNCEHPSHFSDMQQYDPNQHEYLKVPAEGRKAMYVGEICNSCANGHYAQYLHEKDEE